MSSNSPSDNGLVFEVFLRNNAPVMHGCRVNFMAVLQQLPLLNPSTFQSLSAYSTKTGIRIRFLGLSLIAPTQIYHSYKSHELTCEYGPTLRFPVAGRSCPFQLLKLSVMCVTLTVHWENLRIPTIMLHVTKSRKLDIMITQHIITQQFSYFSGSIWFHSRGEKNRKIF